MSVPPSNDWRTRGNDPYRRPTESDYEQAVRGRGFTVPYQAPARPSSPPKGLRRRVKQYRDLRRQARANSMSWWMVKAVQGIIMGCFPFVLGIMLVVVYTLVGGSVWLSMAGMGMVLGGLAIIGWYVAAPATCKWIVTVPENRYWVVEDGNGHTAEYLPPGRLIVPFRMNSRVHDYVDFHTIIVRELYEDVLRGSGRKVDLEVNVVLAFNPTEADPRLYARLRTLTRREQFEDLVANTIRDSVSRYFTRLSPEFWHSALRDPKILEEQITDQLVELESMGLLLASSQPVTVFVHGITLSSAAMPGASWDEPDWTRRADAVLSQDRVRRDDQQPRMDPLPDQSFDQQPTVRHSQHSSRDSDTGGGYAEGDRLPSAPAADDLGTTMPHGRTPAFIPGSFDGETDIETLLQQAKTGDQPKDERRARRTDASKRDQEGDMGKTLPRTTRPDFWIRRRKDRD
jgi:hypothetical protein